MTVSPPDDDPPEGGDAPEAFIARPWIYIAAGAVYITIGVFVPWVFTWWRGFLFVMLAAWLIPLLYLRWRR